MGVEKRIRSQRKNAVSRTEGRYVISGRSFGPGMKRSVERLTAKRKVNSKIPDFVPARYREGA